MCGPGNQRATKYANGEPGEPAAAPTGGDAQKNHGQIEGPGEEEESDFGIADPIGADVDESPNHSGDCAGGDEHKTGVHGLGDDLINGAEWGQAVGRGRYILALQLPFLQEIVDRRDGREDQGRIADEHGGDVNDEPDAAHLRAAPLGHRKLGCANQRHKEDEREQTHPEYGDSVFRVRDQKNDRQQEGAHRTRFVEIVQR